MDTLYTSKGEAIAYIDDDEQSIYLFNGKPVAWLSNERVYTYKGMYLGWYQAGWIYDRFGNPALFTTGATGGPARPVRRVRPVRSVRIARPPRGAREVAPPRPTRSMSWSTLSGVQFFKR